MGVWGVAALVAGFRRLVSTSRSRLLGHTGCPIFATSLSSPTRQVPLPMFSFTGNKKSILGDLNFYGKAALDGVRIQCSPLP